MPGSGWVPTHYHTTHYHPCQGVGGSPHTIILHTIIHAREWVGPHTLSYYTLSSMPGSGWVPTHYHTTHYHPCQGVGGSPHTIILHTIIHAREWVGPHTLSYYT